MACVCRFDWRVTHHHGLPLTGGAGAWASVVEATCAAREGETERESFPTLRSLALPDCTRPFFEAPVKTHTPPPRTHAMHASSLARPTRAAIAPLQVHTADGEERLGEQEEWGAGARSRRAPRAHATALSLLGGGGPAAHGAAASSCPSARAVVYIESLRIPGREARARQPGPCPSPAGSMKTKCRSIFTPVSPLSPRPAAPPLGASRPRRPPP